jgi:ferritin-like metal-binding protein YciE
MPYIGLAAPESSLEPGLEGLGCVPAAVPRRTMFRIFGRVLVIGRNNRAACRLAQGISNRTHLSCRRWDGPRDRVPETRKDQAMGLFTKDIKTMDDLFGHQLQDIYYAEKQLVKALPKMAEKATDKQLKQGFLSHLEETKTHVQRLEQVFQMVGVQVKAVDCPAIDGIIEEADEVAGEVADKSVLDAALINAGQAAEHYEITRYGSLIAWAKQLGRNDCASVLQKTLDEERATDKKLTTLAESKINLRAAS